MVKNIKESAKFEKDMFLVNTLGIIFNPSDRKILIGKRKNDPLIPELSWSFPGGSVKCGEDPERALERTIKEKTGLVVGSLGPVFLRIPKEKDNFLLIYYLCEIIKGEETPLKDFSELKWVRSQELKNYFTTSFDPRLSEYILNLR
jgi:ADP-ribose pyrophosphatase YjhB (NUDIX family)